MNGMDVQCMNLDGAMPVFAKKDRGRQRKSCH